ncbi:MAG TPA: hypothetical protein VMH83_07430, partial [Candidatus Acidoferrum sp.]|nr:hypothetical protein [Candidatus Acidoferrum sp.]
MKIVITILAAILTCGCASEPPVHVPDIVGQASNACLPEAILMAESFHKQGIQARILIINTSTFSHAAVVFLYPSNMPALWVWDSTTKSIQVKADFDDP